MTNVIFFLCRKTPKIRMGKKEFVEGIFICETFVTVLTNV